MASPAPTPATPWERLAPDAVAALLAGTPARWWLSGGAALDRWLGAPIRERGNTDVSTISRDLARLIDALPAGFTAWAMLDEDDLVRFDEAPEDADIQPVLIHDDEKGAWVLQVNVEDGIDRAWLYRRDPRLQLPWDRAVLEIDDIPTGAPEVQLVWKALRPRPEDEVDKDAVLPTLSDEARAFYETALLRIHPHSTWAIHVRSPLTPAKASWNRKKT